MCKLCHDNISDEAFEASLDHNIGGTEQFVEWNSTSIGMIVIGACIRNNTSIRTKCMSILQQYINWRYDQTILLYDHYDYNIPLNGLELMPSKQTLEHILSTLRDINSNYNYELHEQYLTRTLQMNIMQIISSTIMKHALPISAGTLFGAIFSFFLT